MTAGFVAVIPARYASTRLPGKPLKDIAGKPMIEWVYRQTAQSGASEVIVATDDERIAAACRAFGARVEMTSTEHASGTDRIAELARRFQWADEQIVVNVQGDEPLVPASLVDALVGALLDDPRADLATPVVGASASEVASPDVVTAACDEQWNALYFSRSAIPHGAARYWKHLGVYAYRKAALERFVHASPIELEAVERLEQLRALSLGLRVRAVEVDVVTHAVDRPDDVTAVEAILRGAAAPAASIRLVVLDADGVLTDGRIQYLGEEQLVSFDVKDGYGVVALLAGGVQVAVVSSRDSAALRRRARELGIEHVRTSVPDKVAALEALCTELGIAPAEVCVVGDDDPDVPVMTMAGCSAAPADASPAARDHATVVLGSRGGRGAVRELADRLLAGEWPAGHVAHGRAEGAR